MAFRDPKTINFLGEHALRLPQVWGAFGKLTFLPLHAPSKSHAMLLTTGILQQETWSRRGWRGRGCILTIVIAKEGYNFYMIHLLPPTPTRNKRTVPKHEIINTHPSPPSYIPRNWPTVCKQGLIYTKTNFLRILSSKSTFFATFTGLKMRHRLRFIVLSYL